MNNKLKIVGIIALCVFATILGVWSQCSKKEETIISSVTIPEEELLTDENYGDSECSEDPIVDVSVHVCGFVQNPGVYVLEPGKRVTDAITAAGGFLDEADENYLNLADYLVDGTKIYVPSKEEVQNSESMQVISIPENPNTKSESGMVNINTATKEELMSLPGVGESKAEAIMEYRNVYGGFSAIEDIMNIRGIKEGLFNKIKDKIRV